MTITKKAKQHRPRTIKSVSHERSGTAHQRGYTYKWQVARRIFLRQHPLCIICSNEGHVTPATVVDHITPHRGNKELFWNRDNWQPLCKPHHDHKTLHEGK